MVLFKSVNISLISCVPSFTFQYGSIQMSCSDLSVSDAFTFTFQYGSIQILKSMMMQGLTFPLHSNMVLFKW